MALVKTIAVIILVLVAAEYSPAGEIMSAIAPEYFEQGLFYEGKGMLFEAKVYYQKALLLAPELDKEKSVSAKIAKINSLLYAYDEPAGSQITPRDRMDTLPQASRIYAPGQGKDTITSVVPRELNLTTEQKEIEFLAYYNGSEPFLRDCDTPLCRKILLNNQGIVYARQGNITEARRAFEECLTIDPYFKPASVNLNLLNGKNRAN